MIAAPGGDTSAQPTGSTPVAPLSTNCSGFSIGLGSACIDVKDLSLPGGDVGALVGLAGGAAERAQMHELELVAEVAPAVVGADLGHPDQQEGQPAARDRSLQQPWSGRSSL